MAETKRRPQCRGQKKTRHGEALCVLERGHPGDHYMPALEWRGLSPHVPNRMRRTEAAPEDGCGGPKEACPACDSPKEHESFRCPECGVTWCDGLDWIPDDTGEAVKAVRECATEIALHIIRARKARASSSPAPETTGPQRRAPCSICRGPGHAAPAPRPPAQTAEPADRDALIDRLYRAHKAAAGHIAEFGIPGGEYEDAVDSAWTAVCNLGPDPECEQPAAPAPRPPAPREHSTGWLRDASGSYVGCIHCGLHTQAIPALWSKPCGTEARARSSYEIEPRAPAPRPEETRPTTNSSNEEG